MPEGAAEISESQLHLVENVLDTGPMTLHFLNVLLVSLYPTALTVY